MSEQKSSTNDYAVAQALNERAWQILWYVADLYPLYEKDRDIVNRNYIFLVHELEKIYNRNDKLQAIEPKSAWQQYELIDGNEKHFIELQDDRTGDTGQAHTAKVKRLCILSEVEEPVFTKQQKELVKATDKIIAVLAKTSKEEQAQAEAFRQKSRNWYISEYTLTYKYGAIIVNDVLKLKKAHDGSALDELMLQACQSPNKIFAFTPKKPTERSVSIILSSAGFTEPLRRLFFPETGKSRGVFFRPNVSHEKAKAEHIDTAELDQQLKELGATTESLS